MPLYEYECRACGRVSEFLSSSSAPVQPAPSCRVCGSADLERLIALPNIGRARPPQEARCAASCGLPSGTCPSASGCGGTCSNL